MAACRQGESVCALPTGGNPMIAGAPPKAKHADAVRLLLERVAGRHPVPPERRVGYVGKLMPGSRWSF
jgi:hypothetical protein